jgi:hypothetical protein
VSSPHGDSHLTTRLRSADDQLNRKSFSVDNNAGSPLLALLRGLEGNARHLRYNAGPSSRRNLDS